MDGIEVTVTNNGKEVRLFLPKVSSVSYLTDSFSN